MRLPRIMIAAPHSGSGKTLITCGILQALKNQGRKLASFKCGPDYIDPMFHGRVIGVSSKNLDTFFTGEVMTRYLFAREAEQADLSVMEGVMGYYDGVAGIDTQASAYDLARITDTPVVLIVDVRGMSLSAAALVKGFLEYRPDSRIAGVILNRISPILYPRLKEQLEAILPIKVLGYVPQMEECVLDSRHLGLVTPGEIRNIQKKLQALATCLEKTLDLDGFVSLAEQAPSLSVQKPHLPDPIGTKVRIGIAQDEAFCFCYRDNLQLLEELGAELVPFSPLRSPMLPDKLDGLILYGGYPELYASALSANTTLRAEIRKAFAAGMPHLAECGGFMYLHQELVDMEGRSWPMVGTISGKVFPTGKLCRFGYVSLTANKEQIFGGPGESIKAHEFHYYDSDHNGEDFMARKPLGGRNWSCIHADEQRSVGFPHLYYYSNPGFAASFLERCAVWKPKYRS